MNFEIPKGWSFEREPSRFTTIAQGPKPPDPIRITLWHNTNDERLYRWDGTAWVSPRPNKEYN